MTPEQARRAYEAMSPDTKALFEEFIGRVCDIVTKLDNNLTDAGQTMADDAEKWLQEETR